MILQGGNILNFISLDQMNFRPDVMIILMVFFALKFESISGLIACFLLGLGADIVSLPMGPFVIAFTIAGALIANIRKSSVADNIVFQAILIFVATIVILGGAEFIKYIADKDVSSHLIKRIFVTGLYNLVFGPILLLLIDGFWSGLGMKKQ